MYVEYGLLDKMMVHPHVFTETQSHGAASLGFVRAVKFGREGV